MENSCIHHLFEKQVEITPNAVAVNAGGNAFTYNQINHQANRLALFLVQKFNIEAGQAIGLMLTRSERSIIAILAILKAGGAYLPLDPLNPVNYNTNILHDSDVKILVSEGDSLLTENYNGFELIILDKPGCFTGEGENLNINVSAQSLAYIIYTSGSTGLPKGVMIEHHSLLNKISWMQEHYQLTVDDAVLQKTNFVFDVSIWELFWPIIAGARLCFLPPGEQFDTQKILNQINILKITVIHFVPSMLQLFLNYLALQPSELNKLKTIRRLFTSGEALTLNQVKLFKQLIIPNYNIALSNQYGPTEAAIEVSYYDVDFNKEIDVVPIGKPIKNTMLYILDEHGNKLLDGETGELCIAGEQVGRGYINKSELTDKSFVDNTFSPFGKMYKTGDKARYLPDGNLVFLGRIDEQLKINGYRIEPGTIETLILKNDDIATCIVAVKSISGIDELVVYLMLYNHDLYTKGLLNTITKNLSEQLPGYMVPVFFMQIKSMPLTNTGKINKSALPLPTQRFYLSSKASEPIKNATEIKLIAIFKNALQVDEVGTADNFFDLGVSSLLAAKVVNDINKALKSNLPLSILYQLPTISQLASEINFNEHHNISPVILLKQGTGIPLFLFPGWNGTPMTFKEFTAIYKGDEALYSIVYPDDTAELPFKTLQAYVKYLVLEIKKIIPKGPYSFLGYSMGGRIAFELALQLQKQNDTIKMLAVVSDFPAYPATGSLQKRKFLDELRTFSAVDLRYKIKYLRYRLPNSIKYFFLKKLNFHADYIEGNNNHYNQIFSLWENYELSGKYNGNLLLFHEVILKTNEDQFKRIEGFRRAIYPQHWKDVVNGDLKVEKLSYNHLELMGGLSGSFIATVVNNHLR